MNRTELQKSDLTAWRELIDRPASNHIFVLAVFFLASLFILPYAADDNIACLYLLSAVLLLYYLSRSMAFVVRAALPAAALWALIGTPLLSTAFVALLLGGTCGTILLLSCRRLPCYLLWCLAPVAALVGIFFLRSDPYNALLVLMPLPIALGGFVLVRRCVAKTPAVISLAFLLAGTLAAAGLVTLYAMDMLHGNPVEMLGNALNGAITQAFNELAALYAEMDMTMPFSDVDVRNLSAMLVNLLPGLYGVVCLLAAFWCQQMQLSMLQGLGMIPRIPLRLRLLTISPVAAVLFLVSYLVSTVANGDGVTLAGVVALNFSLLLEPGLALVGFTSLSGRGGNRSCLSGLLFMGLIALLFFNPAVALVLSAFCGAVHVILEAFRARPPKK